MSSSAIQVALIDALLPRNFLVRRQMIEELEDAEANIFSPNKDPKSLMMMAAESSILSRLRNQTGREKVLEINQDFRVLLKNMPLLIESPELALARFQKELFSEPVEWVTIDTGKASLEIKWNRYQPLLFTKKMGKRESVDWALKFLKTAVEKKLSTVDIYFENSTDEEFEKTHTEFMATAIRETDRIMESTNFTYLCNVYSFLKVRTIHFKKVLVSEVDFYKWEWVPVEW